MYSDQVAGRALRSEELSFAFAAVLVAGVFGLLLPLAAYVCRTMLQTFDVEMPKVPGALIQASPWMPLALAVAGIALLVATRKSRGGRSMVRWNVSLIAAALMLGGLWALALVVPVWSLMEALPN